MTAVFTYIISRVKAKYKNYGLKKCDKMYVNYETAKYIYKNTNRMKLIVIVKLLMTFYYKCVCFQMNIAKHEQKGSI